MIERIALLSTKKDTLLFTLLLFFIGNFSLLMEYNNYKHLTQFESTIIDATVLKQYSKGGKHQVLKLKADKGFSFYTSASKKMPYAVGKKMKLEVWMGKISFYQFLKGFYAYSHHRYTYKTQTLKYELNHYLDTIHQHQIAQIYKALFTATPLPRDLQQKFSTLGISHLIAISGFHLTVLLGVLYFFLRYPYKSLQQRYFPYRSYTFDLFIITGVLLLLYLLFLDAPPSLMRAYAMFVVGFILYDRGFEVFSMQTLFISVALLIALFPRLALQLGFFLSVSGVYFIFLFLQYFSHLKKSVQFIVLPFWIYLLMLPLSLYFFGTFSTLHPLSILWTSLFTLFYPISIFVHIIGLPTLLDPLPNALLSLDIHVVEYHMSSWLFYLYLIIAFWSMWSKKLLIPLFILALFYCCDAFIAAINHMA